MKNRSFTLAILTILLCCSCVTKALWENTDPNEYYKIAFSQITEEELVGREVNFIRDDRNKAFYVEKDSVEKLQDYTLRILGTPITVAVDAVLIVVVAYFLAQPDTSVYISY